MPEIDTLHFKHLLAERRAQLLADENSSGDAADPVELDQTRVGRVSRMDAMQAQAVATKTRQRRQDELRQIEAALNRIANGEYGLCLRCEETISAARLAFNPATPLCIHCAEMLTT